MTEDVVSRLAEERAQTLRQIGSLRASFDDIVAAADQVATDDEHDPEGHTIAWERQQVAALLTAAEARLAEFDAAAARARAGTYGICESCGAAIPAARLEVLPTTATCVDCAP